MTELPSGTVTFLFTDIQNSTKMWQAHPHKMQTALKKHDAILHEVIRKHNGYVFKTVGDAFCAAFHTAMDGINAAVSAQYKLQHTQWDKEVPIRVRMSIHTGEAEERNNDYYGPALNRVARLESLAHGNQTLVSLVTTELVRDMLPERVTLKDMGSRRLKDLTRPEMVFQLVHGELQDDFPPLKSLDTHPHNLPIQPTTLIGREKDIDTIRKCILEDKARLVTLTGPGGIGKTRLGLQTAADLIDFFEDGAFFIDLSAVDEVNYVVPVIARTLHLNETSGKPFFDILRDYLSPKKMLLVIDNFEQVMKATNFLLQIMKKCAEVVFVVTSREALNVRGERIFNVSPLQLPDLTKAENDEGLPYLQNLNQYESVRLFIERAQALHMDFVINNDNAPAVAEICVRLDGIPLAIELAASRIKVLTPDEILMRLEDALRFLTGGAKDLPPRHRTLRAALSWSYDMLEEKQQRFFQVFSIFPASFTLGAVENICATLGFCEEDVLQVVDSILDKSLLQKMEKSEGAPRFFMLETIKSFGKEKAEKEGIIPVVKRDIGKYYLNLAEKAEEQLLYLGIKDWMKCLDDEYNNFLEIINWYIEDEEDSQNREISFRITAALREYWKIRGYLSQGRELINKVYQVASKEQRKRSGVQAKLLLGAGSLARTQGYYREAISKLKEALHSYEGLDDARGIVQAYHELGWGFYRDEDMDEAEQWFIKGKEKCQSLDNPVLPAMMDLGIGLISLRRNNTEKAKILFEKCSTIFHEHGALRLLGQTFGNFGFLYYTLGKENTAKIYFKKAFDVWEQYGEVTETRIIKNNLAYLYLHAEETDYALQYYRSLLEDAKRTADPRWASAAYSGLADVYYKKKNFELALQSAQSASEEVKDMHNCVEKGIAFRTLGQIYAVQHETGKAQDFFEKAIPILKACMEEEELEKAFTGLKEVANDV